MEERPGSLGNGNTNHYFDLGDEDTASEDEDTISGGEEEDDEDYEEGDEQPEECDDGEEEEGNNNNNNSSGTGFDPDQQTLYGHCKCHISKQKTSPGTRRNGHHDRSRTSESLNKKRAEQVKFHIERPLGKPKKRHFVHSRAFWTDEETECLLRSIERCFNEDNIFDRNSWCRSRKSKWKIISDHMKKAGFHDKTLYQIEKKYQNMTWSYRTVKAWKVRNKLPLYEDLTSTQRKQLTLPSVFPPEWYSRMGAFFASTGIDARAHTVKDFNPKHRLHGGNGTDECEQQKPESSLRIRMREGPYLRGCFIQDMDELEHLVVSERKKLKKFFTSAEIDKHSTRCKHGSENLRNRCIKSTSIGSEIHKDTITFNVCKQHNGRTCFDNGKLVNDTQIGTEIHKRNADCFDRCKHGNGTPRDGSMDASDNQQEMQFCQTKSCECMHASDTLQVCGVNISDNQSSIRSCKHEKSIPTCQANSSGNQTNIRNCKHEKNITACRFNKSDNQTSIRNSYQFCQAKSGNKNLIQEQNMMRCASIDVMQLCNEQGDDTLVHQDRGPCLDGNCLGNCCVRLINDDVDDPSFVMRSIAKSKTNLNDIFQEEIMTPKFIAESVDNGVRNTCSADVIVKEIINANSLKGHSEKPSKQGSEVHEDDDVNYIQMEQKQAITAEVDIGNQIPNKQPCRGTSAFNRKRSRDDIGDSDNERHQGVESDCPASSDSALLSAHKGQTCRIHDDASCRLLNGPKLVQDLDGGDGDSCIKRNILQHIVSTNEQLMVFIDLMKKNMQFMKDLLHKA